MSRIPPVIPGDQGPRIDPKPVPREEPPVQPPTLPWYKRIIRWVLSIFN